MPFWKQKECQYSLTKFKNCYSAYTDVLLLFSEEEEESSAAESALLDSLKICTVSVSLETQSKVLTKLNDIEQIFAE